MATLVDEYEKARKDKETADESEERDAKRKRLNRGGHGPVRGARPRNVRVLTRSDNIRHDILGFASLLGQSLNLVKKKKPS